jgi:hypothetical protein
MVREEVKAGRDPTWYAWVTGAVYVVIGMLMTVIWSSYGPVRGEKKEKKEKKKKEEKEGGGRKA